MLSLSEPLFLWRVDAHKDGTLGNVSWLVRIHGGTEKRRVSVSGFARAWREQLVVQRPKVARTGEAVFSIAPALPAGLSLDPKTGVVSGTPSAAVVNGSFAVTMKDLVGSVSAPLQLSVTVPDRRKPVVTLKAKASQRVVKAKALFVAASCDEGCILTLNSVVTVKGVKGRVVAIPAVRTLKTAKGTSFKVVFAPDAQAALASLLAKGRQGSAASQRVRGGRRASYVGGGRSTPGVIMCSG